MEEIFPNKVLKNIVSAPWYVKNEHVYRDLGLTIVAEEIKKIAKKHDYRFTNIPRLKQSD